MSSDDQTVANLKMLQSFVSNKLDTLNIPQRSATEKMVLLAEEVGEVAGSIRELEGLHSRKPIPKSPDDLGDELVDVLNYLFDIANHYDIDLDKAFARKWAEVDNRFKS